MQWTDEMPTQEGWYWFRVLDVSRQNWRTAIVVALSMATFQSDSGTADRKLCIFPPAPYMLEKVCPARDFCTKHRVEWCRIPTPQERSEP